MVTKHVRRFATTSAALTLGLQCVTGTAACRMEQFLSIPITMVGYKPVVTAQINGMEAHLVLDTGAFFGLLYPRPPSEPV